MTRKKFQLSTILLFFLSSVSISDYQEEAGHNLASLSKSFESANSMQIVVDRNGPPDFNSIQKAIDSISPDNNERVVVNICPGFYRERVIIPKNKSYITLRGVDPYKTVISYNLNAQMMRPDGMRTYGADCATVVVRGASDIILENLTIENTFGPHPQAQALKLASDRAIAVNCRLLGGQDTIMTHSGRQYFLNCYIEGGTDFIYGHAQGVFENCRIHSKESSHITAHAATEPNLPTGYVFYNCDITTDEEVVTDLGRPWRPYAKVIYYNCTMDKGIKPFGWDNWRDPNREKTAFFAEYNSSGPGANPAARVKWSHQLSDQKAKSFLPENFLKIDGTITDSWLQKIIDYSSANSIEKKILDVRRYGAAGDGKTIDTAAIQNAIDDCGKYGGGTVLISAGTYLSRPLFLRNNVTLQIDKDAKLKATDDPLDFIKPGKNVETAGGSSDFFPFVGGKNLTDICITGRGVIDGSGVRWWIPAEEARTKQAGFTSPRPRMILFEDCKNVKIIGVSLVNSPSFHLVPKRCENVLIDGVTIRCPSIAPNTDAIDPSECRNILITNCLIDVGDDNVALKSGKQNPKYPNHACANITVSNCTFIHGHGMSIGSETVGGVFNLVVENCIFERLAAGIRIKSARGKGGIVENISYRNIFMRNVKIPISLSSWYEDSPEDETPQPFNTLTPVFRNISIKNVFATSPCGDIESVERINDFLYYYYAYHDFFEPRNAGVIAGLPECEITNVSLENIRIKSGTGMTIQNARNIKMKNVKVETIDGEPFIIKNAQVAGLNY